MDTKIYYTGIGSRNIPTNIQQKFIIYGKAFAQLNFVLRSGAAAGADTAFEIGCDASNGEKEIYLPWKDFRNHSSSLHYISPEALHLASDIYGPSWRYAKKTTKLFMARNMYQVSGLHLDAPSKFVVCWTPDGCNSKRTRKKTTGGTGQAISYADELDIPIFNLYNTEDEIKLFNFLTEGH